MRRVLRRRWVGVLAGLVLLPLVAFGAYGYYLADSADMLPWQADPTRIPVTPFADIPGFTQPTAAARSSPAAPTATATATAAAATTAAAGTAFEVVGAESSAGYVAQEELTGVGAAEAIGTTNSVAGRVVLDAAGAPTDGTRIDVDLRTLTSDEPRRDNYLRGNSLETDAYPLATFVATGVENWPGALVEGRTATFNLLGDLTIRDVTRPVTWETTATLTGSTLRGAATTTIRLEDFAIEPPVVGPVVSIDESIRLDLSITAVRAS